MDYTTTVRESILKSFQDYDEAAGLISTYIADGSDGYHTKRTGIVHPTFASASFAAAVLCEGLEELYPQALRILEIICDAQDVRPGSKTFGLWGHNYEDDPDHMIAPDYNWADFVGKCLQESVLFSQCPLPETLKAKLLTAIRNAAICSIGRNVGLDYSNIAVMSSLTITCAGEIVGDPQIFAIGKDRLERVCAYTRFNGAYSEYNSSCYGFVIMDDVSRMLRWFKDARCLELAKELNYFAWKQVAEHYNMSLFQLSPPQARAYEDLNKGSIAWRIRRGTYGKYGNIDSLAACNADADQAKVAPLAGFSPSLEMLRCPSYCPEELYPLFEESERFIAHTYYKQNSLRRPGEDYTIIRDPDNPDMTAYSLLTPDFSMGVFSLCDTWVQRRNCMVVWDKENPKCFRIRSIVDGYDFCGGVTYARQKDNRILGQVGLVTDRGRVHYIIDKEKNGIYETDTLHFRFDLGGACEGLTIRRDGKDFFVEDGDLTIRLHVEKWLYDGKDAPVYVSENGKSVILEGYQGEQKLLDTNLLAETCGVFTLTVEDAAHKAEPAELTWKLEDSTLSSRWGELEVASPAKPVTYRQALGI